MRLKRREEEGYPKIVLMHSKQNPVDNLFPCFEFILKLISMQTCA